MDNTQKRTGGSAEQTIPPQAKDVSRFWSKVEVGGQEECWLWRGKISVRGYGVFKASGKNRLAHRVALQLDGRPAIGLLALHSCDNPRCVNPAHLRPGTNSDNMQDCIARGRRNDPIGDRNGSVRKPERLPRGEMCGWSKVTEDDVRTIRASTATEIELAAQFGISRGTVGYIRRRASWRHVA